MRAERHREPRRLVHGAPDHPLTRLLRDAQAPPPSPAAKTRLWLSVSSRAAEVSLWGGSSALRWLGTAAVAGAVLALPLLVRGLRQPPPASSGPEVSAPSLQDQSPVFGAAAAGIGSSASAAAPSAPSAPPRGSTAGLTAATRSTRRRPPAVRPPPLSAAAAPATSPTPPAATGEASLGAESRLLQRALVALRDGRDPAGALALIDTYGHAFPRGELRDEAQLLRLEADVAANRPAAALGDLDPGWIARSPRADELSVLRGELLVQTHRTREALPWFEKALAGGRGEIQARALAGRAAVHRELNSAQE